MHCYPLLPDNLIKMYIKNMDGERMRKDVRDILGEELANYMELLRAKVAFAEELYGIKMNYVPLVTEEPVVILDKNDGRIKWLKDKRELSENEFRELAEKIRKNLESGFVEMLLAMNMGCINGPGE
jgi:iron only hydrogenase large subunit-like protein